MKKKRYLQTSFIKFLNEKLTAEETNVSDEEIIKNNEIPDEDEDNEDEDNEDEDNEDEDTIENLIKEFNEMEKKYKTLKDDKIYNKK